MPSPDPSTLSETKSLTSDNSVILGAMKNTSDAGLKTLAHQLFALACRCDRFGVVVTRIGIIIVLFWIGGLKAFDYEAEGIIPFVANSPLMSFFLTDPSGYAAHKNAEGAFVPANRRWHEHNHTYTFAEVSGR